MLSTFITFPADFASSTMAITGPVIADLSPYLTTVIGVMLAVLAIVLIIRAIIHH